jgi:hypothetical protein
MLTSGKLLRRERTILDRIPVELYLDIPLLGSDEDWWDVNAGEDADVA